jgi:hypothetical protein
MSKIIDAVVEDRNQDIRHIRHLPILIEGVTSALKEYLQNPLPTEDFSKTEVWGEVIDKPPNRQGSKGYHILNLSLSLVKLIPSSHRGIQNHMSKRKNLSKEKIDDSTDNEDDSSDNEDDSSDNEDESSLDPSTIISSWLPFLILDAPIEVSGTDADLEAMAAEFRASQADITTKSVSSPSKKRKDIPDESVMDKSRGKKTAGMFPFSFIYHSMDRKWTE